MNGLCLVLCSALAIAGQSSGLKTQAHGYLREGDLWVLVGASETGIDQYRQVVQAAIDHFHPHAGIRLVNRGVWGRLAEEARDAGKNLKPTVVSIVLGGNNVLHADRPPVYDFRAQAARYGEEIRRQVASYRAQGADVVLIKPFHVHETEQGFFGQHNMRPAMEAFREALSRIAAEERCPLLDFGDEYDKVFAPSVGSTEVMMPDGVHTYGRGQYCYARSLIHHFGVAQRLARADEPRFMDPTPLTAVSDVSVSRVAPFLPQDDAPPEVMVACPQKGPATVAWSVEGSSARGAFDVVFDHEPVRCRLPVPATELPREVGRVGRIVVSVTPVDGRPRLAIVDLARTRTVDISSGTATDVVRRADGSVVATWEARIDGSDLWLSGHVIGTEYPPRPKGGAECWMNSTGMNGFMLMYDFRSPEMFAENVFDRNVGQIQFSVLDKPWSVGALAWLNIHYQCALRAAAEQTVDGYDWRLGFRGYCVNYRKFDVSKHPYFGLHFFFRVCEGGQMAFYSSSPQLWDDPAAVNPERRVNQQMVFDRTGKLPKDAVTVVSVFSR